MLNLFFTLTAAFALSKKELSGRGVFMLMIVFTMYFSGGLVPTFLLLKDMVIVNTIWVMIIPGLVSPGNLIIARTFFANSVPRELEEAAIIDGCSITRAFIYIVLPLSKPIISVMALYYGVGHWNAYFNALIYLSDRDKYPLQLILRDILISSQMMSDMMSESADEIMQARMKFTALIRYSVIIVSSLPVIMIYPFLQKYFAKGVMIGAIKG